MEVAANFHSSNLHQKSLGQLPLMSDKAVQQRQETLKDIPLQHFSSQKVVHNYEGRIEGCRHSIVNPRFSILIGALVLSTICLNILICPRNH